MDRTAHMVGDLVRSTVQAQGLDKGELYRVQDVTVRRMAWGTFVTYWLLKENGDLLSVANGHLVLKGVAA